MPKKSEKKVTILTLIRTVGKQRVHKRDILDKLGIVLEFVMSEPGDGGDGEARGERHIAGEGVVDRGFLVVVVQLRPHRGGLEE